MQSVSQAKEIAGEWLCEINLDKVIGFGLPEIDDRYHIWRVPLRNGSTSKIGEVVIDAYTTAILEDKTTRPEMLEARLLQKDEKQLHRTRRAKPEYRTSSLHNTVGCGDCSELLEEMPAASVDLIFTSPPYFNAKPEYSE